MFMMFLYIEIHQQPACIYETVLSKSENTQFRPFSISQFYLHKSVLPNSCCSKSVSKDTLNSDSSSDGTPSDQAHTHTDPQAEFYARLMGTLDTINVNVGSLGARMSVQEQHTRDLESALIDQASTQRERDKVEVT